MSVQHPYDPGYRPTRNNFQTVSSTSLGPRIQESFSALRLHDQRQSEGQAQGPTATGQSAAVLTTLGPRRGKGPSPSLYKSQFEPTNLRMQSKAYFCSQFYKDELTRKYYVASTLDALPELKGQKTEESRMQGSGSRHRMGQPTPRDESGSGSLHRVRDDSLESSRSRSRLSYDLPVLASGERRPQYYDGVGRCGLRQLQRGLAHLPDDHLAEKVQKYAADRNYDAGASFVVKRDTKVDVSELNRKNRERLRKFLKHRGRPGWLPQDPHAQKQLLLRDLTHQLSEIRQGHLPKNSKRLPQPHVPQVVPKRAPAKVT